MFKCKPSLEPKSFFNPSYTLFPGSEYSEHDFTRAFCCRVDDNIFKDVEAKRYHLQHPYIGRPTYTNNNVRQLVRLPMYTYCMNFNYELMILKIFIYIFQYVIIF